MRMGEVGKMSMNRVEVICPGMIVRDGPIVLEARSTATLVSRGERRLLVDTSGPQNRAVLMEALRSRGLGPSDIEMVVLTHAHGDHVGNLDMFPLSTVMAHRAEGGEITLENDIEIWDGVRLVHTPGHTLGSTSVMVEAGDTYAIAGDAIPTEDNARKWVPPGHHYDRRKAMDSMEMLIDAADVVVPGHGPAFRAAPYKDKGRRGE
jgi:glyoxylase-like metal-dependent hydrolase (beta-lactamase superfamily II)